jgi:CheY-like chemotaxis protein
VLIVEDDPVSMFYLSEIVSSSGATIITAFNGQSAIEIFKKTSTIDIILLDIQLPEITGYQVASEIRKINRSLPIIAQTAYATHDDKIKCINAGCSDYVRKPVDHNELLFKMNIFLEIAAVRKLGG